MGILIIIHIFNILLLICPKGLGMNLFSLSGGLNNNIPEKNKTISSTNGQHSLRECAACYIHVHVLFQF